MDYKAIAKETLCILQQGFYEHNGAMVDISAMQHRSIHSSSFVPQEKAFQLPDVPANTPPKIQVRNQCAVAAILDFVAQGLPDVGVLNFASAKNEGGGFLNGAMAQEESLATSSGLYQTLMAHPQYYTINRACASMMYTDNAIYSPDVVFFRDAHFALSPQPFTASVLTLPAVNMGQVLLKKENAQQAKIVMKERMHRALVLLAANGARNLVLGAYGCGVFRNDPVEIATWWKDLLPAFDGCFAQVVFAVLDISKNKTCIRAFEAVFGKEVRDGTN